MSLAHRILAISALATLPLAACDIPAETASSAPEGAEELGQAAQEWGKESTCATQSLTSNDVGQSIAYPSAGATLAYSTDDRYNSAGCPRQWILEVTGWQGSAKQLPEFLNWNAFAIGNSATCTATNTEINYYGFNSSTSTWTTWLYAQNCTGSWSGSTCTPSCTTSGSATTFAGSSYSKIRAAFQAWRWDYTQPSVTRAEWNLINTGALAPF